MKVSIITISLNSAATIEACLRSITAQTHPDIEQISVDGRSVDGTLEILERNRDRFAARLVEPDGGVYQAMNKGLALARGDLVGFLNSDDVYAADDVVAGLVELISHEELDSCYGDLVYGRGDAAGRERTVRYWKAGPFDVRNFEKGWMPPHPTFFVRKRIYERYGAFNLDFPVVADYEIMLRFLYKHRISCGYFPRVVIRKRTGGISRPTALNVVRNNAACYQAWLANGLKPRPGTFVRKALSKLGQFGRRP
ncbi:MAG: glycosyltransferase [Candidatus Aminicenantes bacterium]|nr:glycosyltransferase [Candidatus Aminicenantes bacterium]